MRYFKYVFNAYLAYVIYLFSSRKQINLWLIGGHNGMLYADNARAFHEFISKNRPEISIVWVACKNSPAWKNVHGEKTVKGSVKAYLAFYRSEVSLFSDTFNSDIAPLLIVLPGIRGLYRRRLKVYLSHGTIAFKKLPSSLGFRKKLREQAYQSYDLAVASTPFEMEVMKSYRIRESCIRLVGSARNDKLVSNTRPQNFIIVAPTWREWVTSKNTMIDDPFYLNFTTLFDDVELIGFLRLEGIKITLCLHHMFQRYRELFLRFQNDVVNIAPSDADTGRYIKDAKMMITDYSSMSSDFYYLRKPIHFFHFDRDKYLSNTGSEIDLANSVFGEVSYSVSELAPKIIGTVNGGYRIPPSQITGEQYFVHFRDSNNCSRIYNEVSKAICLRKD